MQLKQQNVKELFAVSLDTVILQRDRRLSNFANISSKYISPDCLTNEPLNIRTTDVHGKTS